LRNSGKVLYKVFGEWVVTMAKFDPQFWKTEGASAQLSAGFSVLAHAMIISGWVYLTMPSAEPPRETALSRVLYLPPPNPTPSSTGSAETIQYVQLSPEGIGAGMVSEGIGVELDLGRGEDPTMGSSSRDSITAAARDGWQGVDSVFTMIEVDTIAARLPESAAPQYPADLLARRVEGQAVVQFVVDTTGLADPGSFVVVLSSHPDFAQSIRDALPGMRFSTARIGAAKVRQLVELPFSFTIAVTAPVESTKVRPTRARRPD
jgi:hypothetical protein